MRFRRAGWGVLIALAVGLGATGAEAECTVGKMAELPVTMEGLRPIISTKINGADARFMVDSGAFYSIISPNSAAKFHLALQEPVAGFHMGGIGGQVNAMLTTVNNFTLAGTTIKRVMFIVGGGEMGYAGLLGQNVLGFADVEYDLPHGAIRLMRARQCEKNNLAYWSGTRPYSVLPIAHPNEFNKHTIGTVFLNGVPIRATFDTGAPLSMLSLRAAERAGVRPVRTDASEGYVGGVGRDAVRSWIAHFASFQIGDEDIQNPRLRIGDIGDTADMLIGADFFISHRVYVSNSLEKMFFTYEGGPVFDLKTRYREEGAPDVANAPPPKLDATAPSDAEGYSRRGAVYASQHDLDHALADFTKAIELDPKQSNYFFQRAAVHAEAKRLPETRADLDHAITLDPKDIRIWIARAKIRDRQHDDPGAIADLDAADKLATKATNERLAIGSTYVDAGAYDKGIAQIDLWLATHPDDGMRTEAFNARCWARALSGQALDKALMDCNNALHRQPLNPNIMDSRALVYLRQGNYDAALRDYDAALKIAPHLSWSLYCRGLIELRRGQKDKGQADMAAATALDPDLAAKARTRGILL